jgi:hypothetical protein
MLKLRIGKWYEFWKNNSKGENLAIVSNFMQMKEFKYKFKDGKIEFIHN